MIRAETGSLRERYGDGRRPERRLAALVGVALTTACAPIWVPIDEKAPRPFDMPTLEMRMNLPRDWMSSYYAPVAGYFFFTVHGAELEEIWVRRFPRTATVKGTNRTIRDGMTVQDIARLSVDSRRLDDGVGAFELVSNTPATVDGRDCFRIDYRYRNSIGLQKRTVEYGCPVSGWIYRIEFMAPEQHYFDRYLPDFEEMVQSIRFTAPGA